MRPFQFKLFLTNQSISSLIGRGNPPCLSMCELQNSSMVKNVREGESEGENSFSLKILPSYPLFCSRSLYNSCILPAAALTLTLTYSILKNICWYHNIFPLLPNARYVCTHAIVKTLTKGGLALIFALTLNVIKVYSINNILLKSQNITFFHPPLT